MLGYEWVHFSLLSNTDTFVSLYSLHSHVHMSYGHPHTCIVKTLVITPAGAYTDVHVQETSTTQNMQTLVYAHILIIHTYGCVYIIMKAHTPARMCTDSHAHEHIHRVSYSLSYPYLHRHAHTYMYP